MHPKYLRASYEVSYFIAKSKKPFTVGEELVHLAAVKIAEIVLGSARALKVKKFPLLSDTIARRISEISENQLQQLFDRVKKVQDLPFSRMNRQI